MATGRTHPKHARFYMKGYDLSGIVRSVGPLAELSDTPDMTTWTDAVKGGLPNHVHLQIGTLNAVFEGPIGGFRLQDFQNEIGKKQTALVPIGIRAAPALGDPVFNVTTTLLGFLSSEDGGLVTVTIPFGEWSGEASSALYDRAWGVLLHPWQNETAINAAGGVDNGVATTAGGYMAYSAEGNGTATIKVQDSADNTIWADLAGATSGVVSFPGGVADTVAIGRAATVRQFLRWQLVFGTATELDFVLSFVRGR